jgi:hypothetical protein
MDIKKIIRQFLLEQPDGEVAPNAANPQPQLTKQQRETYERFASKWKEQVPELTDEQMMKIFLEFRKALTLVKDETQPEVSAFLIRGNGKYNINDLRTPNKVSLQDLLDFLLELTRFRIKIGDNEGGDEAARLEKQRLNNVFNEKVDGGKKGSITPKKIEESKKMWEGQQKLVINEGDFRVYEINTQEEAERFGYYYQEKLRELVIHNIDNQVGQLIDIYRPREDYANQPRTRYDVTPWCVFSRDDDQTVRYNNRMIINPIRNQYSSYREGGASFYVVIDESRNMFASGGEYYISTILARNTGIFEIASMYNGEYKRTEEELLQIYPKLQGHFDVFKFKTFDRNAETDANVPLNITDIINENEGSPNAFWMQTIDNKRAFIEANGFLRKVKSWGTMSNDLRKEYIDLIHDHDVTQKISNEEFMKAIFNSGAALKKRLDDRLKAIGFTGIGYLTDNFMRADYRPNFYGKKNNAIRIYKNIKTNKHGIYDTNEGAWINRDGIEYDAEFTKNVLPYPDGDLEDFTNDKMYTVIEFVSSKTKFYALNDMDDKGEIVYIMSETKYRELSEKLKNEEENANVEDDADIAEEQY